MSGKNLTTVEKIKLARWLLSLEEHEANDVKSWPEFADRASRETGMDVSVYYLHQAVEDFELIMLIDEQIKREQVITALQSLDSRMDDIEDAVNHIRRHM